MGGGFIGAYMGVSHPLVIGEGCPLFYIGKVFIPHHLQRNAYLIP